MTLPATTREYIIPKVCGDHHIPFLKFTPHILGWLLQQFEAAREANAAATRQRIFGQSACCFAPGN